MSLEVRSRILAIPELGPPDALPMVGALRETPYTISADLPPRSSPGASMATPLRSFPTRSWADTGGLRSKRL